MPARPSPSSPVSIPCPLPLLQFIPSAASGPLQNLPFPHLPWNFLYVTLWVSSETNSKITPFEFPVWGRRNGNRTERREGYGSNKLLSYHQFHWQNTISIPTVWTTEKTIQMATRIPLKRSPFAAHRKVSYNSFFSPLSLSSKVQPLPERLQSLMLFLLSAELHSWICFLPAFLPIFNL